MGGAEGGSPSRRIIKIGGNRPSLKQVLANAGGTAQPQPNAEVQPIVNAQPQPEAESEPHPIPPSPNSEGEAYSSDETVDDDDNTEASNVALFTDQSLAKEWDKYCIRLKETDSLMADRMMGMLVKCVGEDTVQISLHNEMVRKKIQPFIADIEQNMQRAFDNPSIKVEIDILPPEIVKVITNPTELLAKMRNDNPNFANLVDKLKLSISS